jgi:hypothetical protein
MKKSTTLVPAVIERRILLIRGQKALLDSDLARIYGVSTSRLNGQVKRNMGRFPEDFMFQLKLDEFSNLISQIATSSVRHGGHRKLPCVFTEHGAIRLASVLKTKRAMDMSVFVVRAFVRMRDAVTVHRDVAEKLRELERRVRRHDENIQETIEAI